MNVGNQRNADLLLDSSQLLRRFTDRDGHPHDVTAGNFQGPDLITVASTSRVSVLVMDWTVTGRIAAHFDLSQLYLSRFSALDHGFTIGNLETRVNKL